MYRKHIIWALYFYIAALAEEAAKKGDSKMVYRLTNEIVGKKTNRTSLVKDENGDIISDPQKADER